jgi:predicted dinucleotide-binding enzyme
MATLGILGTGRMGVRLAVLFANSGVDVRLGSRDGERAKRIVKGLNHERISAGTYKEAAAQQIVLPAIFVRDGLFEILEPYREQMAGKILVDISNPFNSDYSDFILPWNTSSSEQLQHRFPKSTVVGAFKNVFWEVFDQPIFENGYLSDVYVVADDSRAKEAFLKLVGNSPFRYLDAGKLSNARTVERMTLLVGELGTRYGYFPRMNYRLLGEEWKPGQADLVGQLIARAEY